MQLSMPSVRIGAAAPCRAPRAKAAVPLRSAVIRRFKEDDEKEAELKARRQTEDVIRKQEELLKQAAKGTETVQDKLKTDVNRAVDSAGGSTSLGKGYHSPIRVPLWLPAFTRRREVFVGRIAMVGFFATCALEVATHLGPIAQVRLWTGLDEQQVVALLAAVAAYNALGALGPWSPTFSVDNLRDVARRPEGPPTSLVNPLNLGKLLGISGWGFTKRNEVFHGRLAMLGFAAAVVNEMRTGLGPLGQVANYLGVVPDNTWYAACVNGFIAFGALMMGLSILFPSRVQGPAAREEDIY